MMPFAHLVGNSRLAAAFFQQECGKRLDPMESRSITHHAAPLFLLDQPGSGEKAQMVRKRGGGQIKFFLNIANRQAFWTCADQGKQNVEPGLRPDGGKPLRSFLEFDHHRLQHITTI